MDLATAKGLVDLGLGPLAFLALLYGGWQMFKVIRELATNHLAHMQQSLDRIEGLLETLVRHK